ncbi:Stk1 family PASTA domain-containing Ser/Thr kinase [Kroppenstedtia eburnea]|uniref:Serine/threonine-protein kinase PrkC n=1 Tax=Kroppenstedtia eburnea TaxID=714067 RepID=A0A1N7J1V0_9BACL|nr:Stk1 family PASTA domain-containing Ser/Thr kinase [Kroppenstedtia eburnea]SIS43352.1 serine/threonine protein kinase [Kroppenstedtia eburnea]
MTVEGRKLGGRYEVISRIGGGGMAVVYKARDVLLNRHVAIKVLNESLSNDAEFVKRFSREAQAAASLSHPNVVNVYDVGQENHTHYIVMELVEGPTLKEYIQQYSPLTPEEIVSIASQICDALAHAHENQIVHRDVKPHNILLGYNGRAKVTDFGIARASTSSTITQAGSVMGSVHYFSPEQARGGLIGHKSDIYSLGVVLYEMVTGQLPFDGDSAISIAMKHLQDPVEDPAGLNPDVPPEIHRIILKAMEKEPDRRFETALEMKQELDAVFRYDRMEEPRLRTDRHEPVGAKPYAAAGVASSDGGNGGQQTPNRVGDQTMANLERLRNVPADKDKTVLERTVVWLENVQANMPWWQKLLFGLFTLVVIGALAIFTFDMVMGWMAKGDDEVQGQQQKGTAAVEVAKVVGMDADEAEAKLKKMGFQVKVEAGDTTHFGAEHDTGKIYKQTPAAGEKAVPKETEVVLYKNPEMFQVPEVRNVWQTRITGPIAREHGYTPKITFHDEPGLVDGKGITTRPKAGQYCPKGGTLHVWIQTAGQNNPPPEPKEVYP